MLKELLEGTDSHHKLFADSAYRNEEIERQLKEKKIKYTKKENEVSLKLTYRRQVMRKKSMKRARVEHVLS